MEDRNNKREGFSLIELLIVVAIISILASIGVVNFVNAQIRSKVARVMADMHSLALGVESYKVDNNVYAIYTGREKFLKIPPTNTPPADDAPYHFTPPLLTAPISYINALFPDVFYDAHIPPGVPRPQEYHYYARAYSPTFFKAAENANFTGQFSQDSGYGYFLLSPGPDMDFDLGLVFYDPTNGIESSGDLMRWGP